jgi:hypothetical protein
MGHNYRNYVHIEGVLDQDAIATFIPEGEIFRFTVAVRSGARDENRAFIRPADLFLVEVFSVEVGPKSVNP